MISNPRLSLNLLLFITTLCIPISKPYPNSKSIEGDWFSALESKGIGISTYHLRLSGDGRFELFRILLHPRMNWEEKRYSGKWFINGASNQLQAESCQVYTSPSLSSRRALLRAYDCDHLRMDLSIDGDQSILSPNEYGEGHETKFFRPPYKHLRQFKSLEDFHWLRVFAGEKDYHAWGIGVKWMHSKKDGEVWNQEKKLGEVKIQKSLDTSLEFNFQKKMDLKSGDFFLYK